MESRIEGSVLYIVCISTKTLGFSPSLAHIEDETGRSGYAAGGTGRLGAIRKIQATTLNRVHDQDMLSGSREEVKSSLGVTELGCKAVRFALE